MPKLQKSRKLRKSLAILLSLAFCIGTSFVLTGFANDAEPIDQDSKDIADEISFSDSKEESDASRGGLSDEDLEEQYQDWLLSQKIVRNDDDDETIDEECLDVSASRNVSLQQTVNLKKGQSKTYKFNVSGGWFGIDHNAVSVVITKNSGEDYKYLSQNVTTGTTLANVLYWGDASRVMSNLSPSYKYEITIVNNGTSDLNYTISLTSYIKA